MTATTARTTTYQIRRKFETIATVRGTSPEHAADVFARREHGRAVTALRTTGDAGKSGYFHAYRTYRGDSARHSVGEPFHVM